MHIYCLPKSQSKDKNATNIKTKKQTTKADRKPKIKKKQVAWIKKKSKAANLNTNLCNNFKNIYNKKMKPFQQDKSTAASAVHELPSKFMAYIIIIIGKRSRGVRRVYYNVL